MPNAHITGWGMYVPQRVLTNEELSKTVDTSDEWIRDRTGIRERRIATDGETSASLGAEAALKALKIANLAPVDVDLIICSTSTPEHIFPATACLIQDKIGASRAGAFDLLAACSGFIYALNMAAQSIKSGSIKTAVVIGTETLSRVVDWKDRNTCILFGDGAGAFVLQAGDEPGGVLSGVMHSDGSGGDLLAVPAGGSRLPASELTLHAGQHFIHMDGREVFRFATRVMASATQEALAASQLSVSDLSIVIPHQANYRIIESAARGLKLPIDKFYINLDRYGNTSTASIPIATVEAFENGRLHPGDKMVFVGFGAGLTWGALAAQWTGPRPAVKPVNPERYRLFGRIRSLGRRIIRRIEGILFGQDNVV